ncbi:ROK family transcriptional regulator [Streptomyces sp. RB110-2]|uniref:ROK family transcriptional regulator n=1 Tax=Streptomyces sp. RB110-2 TaxID=2794863 RepID=UPI0027DA92CF|nr:ROK family transcriptional regulator [Streptomyces sp. RB110-2]
MRRYRTNDDLSPEFRVDPPAAPVGVQAGTARALNDRAVLSQLLSEGPQSARDLYREIGLSKPTVYLALARLEDLGFLIPHDGVAATGRSSRYFAVRPEVGYVAGAHLSAVEATVMVADVSLARTHGATVSTSGRTPEEVAVALREALDSACRQAGIPRTGLRSVLVGVPGVVEPGRNVLERTPGLPGWERADFASELSRAAGSTVRLDNDINLAAIAEMHFGIVPPYSSFLTLWLDEGVGMGVVLEGKLHRGASGRAGEICSLPASVRGSQSDSKPLHELVDALSLRRLAAEFGLGHGDGRHILRAAAEAPEGTAGARLIDEYSHRIASGLLAPTIIVDPERVVLNGPIALAGGDRLCVGVEDALAPYMPSTPQVQLSKVAGNAVATGALSGALEAAREEIVQSIST